MNFLIALQAATVFRLSAVKAVGGFDEYYIYFWMRQIFATV